LDVIRDPTEQGIMTLKRVYNDNLTVKNISLRIDVNEQEINDEKMSEGEISEEELSDEDEVMNESFNELDPTTSRDIASSNSNTFQVNNEITRKREAEQKEKPLEENILPTAPKILINHDFEKKEAITDYSQESLFQQRSESPHSDSPIIYEDFEPLFTAQNLISHKDNNHNSDRTCDDKEIGYNLLLSGKMSFCVDYNTPFEINKCS